MKIQKLLDYRLFLILQLITSLILIGSFLYLNVLPIKYLIIIIVALSILFLITLFLTRKKDKKLRATMGKLISIIISIVLIIGSFSVIKGKNTISDIISKGEETSYISIYVLNESDYQEPSDLEGKKIEADSTDDNINVAITDLKQMDANLEIILIDDYTQLADDLLNGSTEAIYINEGLLATIDEIYEDFENDTRIIYTFEITQETNDISKNVNVTNTSFNIFISGIDTRGAVSTVSRSDVNMIVTVNPTTKQILMTSIPRDYYVTLANKGKKDKLTHAGLAGVENSVTTLENFLGIEINYYARVNFTSLITMVDALGGIDVYSDKTFVPWTNKNITIYEGTNHMDGAMALAFARERKTYSSGDNHRVQNQQAVLTAMLKKAMSPAIITNYNSVLNSVSGSLETNMSEDEILSLIKMQINDMADWDIEQIQMTGTGSMMYGGAYMPNNKLYYMIPDDDSVSECISKIEKVINGENIN